MRSLILLSVLGLTACTVAANDTAICDAQRKPIAALRAALMAHPETPRAVGEAGTVVVLRQEAGCQ